MLARRFACHHEACQRSFSKAEHLARHERTHLGLKPFACPTCNRRFSRQDSMLRHSRTHEAVRNDRSPTPVADGTLLSPCSSRLSMTPAQNSSTLLEGGSTGTGAVQDSVAQQYPASIDETANSTTSMAPTVRFDDIAVPDDQGVDQDTAVAAYADSMGEANAWDLDFNWTLSTEEMYHLLLNNPSFPSCNNTSTPQYSSNRRNTLGTESQDNHILQDSTDASRKALQTLNRIIRELPEELMARTESMENGDLGSSFFNDCLDLFFGRFLDVAPIIHRPTFNPRECDATVLLHMLALGSCFIGSEHAVSRVSARPAKRARTDSSCHCLFRTVHHADPDLCSAVSRANRCTC